MDIHITDSVSIRIPDGPKSDVEYCEVCHRWRKHSKKKPFHLLMIDGKEREVCHPCWLESKNEQIW